MSQPLQPLAFSAQSQPLEQHVLQPAGRSSVARFESLLYAPDGNTAFTTSAAGSSHDLSASARGLRAYADDISALWRASAQRTEELMNSPTLSYKDLLVFQKEIGSTLVSVELASKASGMVENGVQTLVQRA